MTVCERLFRNFKYELPATDATMFVVNRDLAENPADVLERLLDDPAFRQRSVGRYILSRYGAQFLEETEIELEFQEDAIDALCDKAVSAGDELFEVALTMFHDYEHGLSLVRRNTGKSRFVVTQEVVEDPDGVLSDWIRESYNEQETTS